MKPKKTFKGHKKAPTLKSGGLLRFLRCRYRAFEHVKTFGFETPGSGHLLSGILHGAETQQRAGYLEALNPKPKALNKKP